MGFIYEKNKRSMIYYAAKCYGEVHTNTQKKKLGSIDTRALQWFSLNEGLQISLFLSFPPLFLIIYNYCLCNEVKIEE